MSKPRPSADADQPDSPKKNLRWGFSTGSAATAAALGAAMFLRDGAPPDKVLVRLPGGGDLAVPVSDAGRKARGGVWALVVKDGGDDPDVTNGARISTTLEPGRAPGLEIVGGAGVGRVTRPGLVLPPGEWAVNPTPRKMLADNLAPWLREGGLRATVSIDQGEELAKKTLNPKLGIVGGLSVLGTTGLVKPFSNQAYVATIDQAMAVARAGGATEIVLSTGGRSEGLARKMRPDLPEECFVQIADFFHAGIRLAVRHEFEIIGLAEFFGKAVKQAAGFKYTHARRHVLDLGFLADRLPGLEGAGREVFLASPTALAALEVLKGLSLLSAVPAVARLVLRSARDFAGGGPGLWAAVFDFDGRPLALETDGASPGPAFPGPVVTGPNCGEGL
ncbi:MAG: cobalt-precorrin-5B (C(1))-methyltransferase CbiD [Deltaproteobacteria bacterium]|jgi:cobalt-precorrin-5B (C1)-methyltransferase|nr:cobalt-precorrin-5B (C(1))-methyltransferase CbiD [Deltaproteobacteria bacterium]